MNNTKKIIGLVILALITVTVGCGFLAINKKDTTDVASINEFNNKPVAAEQIANVLEDSTVKEEKVEETEQAIVADNKVETAEEKTEVAAEVETAVEEKTETAVETKTETAVEAKTETAVEAKTETVAEAKTEATEEENTVIETEAKVEDDFIIEIKKTDSQLADNIYNGTATARDIENMMEDSSVNHEVKEEVIEAEDEPEVVEVSADDEYSAMASLASKNYSSYINEVYNLINDKRAAAGAAKVALDNTLTVMACHRTVENAENDFFQISGGHHVRPNGLNASSICEYYGQYGCFGEIMGRYQSTSSQIVNDWTASGSHYSTMVSDTYTRVGVGVAQDSEGYFYWTAIFMN